MPYNPSSFAGLYQEGGFNLRNYFWDLELFEEDAGETLCPHDADPPFHFEPWIAECRANQKFDVTRTADLAQADFFTLGGDVTVAARGALTPTPAYAQVFVDTRVETIGGIAQCPPVESSVACGDFANALMAFEVATGFGAEFPFDNGEPFHEYSRLLEQGATTAESGLLNGYLTRPPDGDTYAGDPTNDAVDTLIPWDQFIADASFSVQIHFLGVFGVNILRAMDQADNHVIVRLFYTYTPPAEGEGLSCFFGGA